MKRKQHTEKELLAYNQSMIYSLARLFRVNQSTFYSIAEYLPTHLVINDKNELNYKFANPFSLNTLEIDEFNHMNFKVIQERSEPFLLKMAFQKIKLFDEINDKHAICSTFQKFRYRNRMNWIIGNKVIIDDSSFLNNFYEIQELHLIGDKIKSIIEPGLIDIDNWQKFQSLTKREKELLVLIANGFNNKQISNLLFISENTIRTHRERIRSKLCQNNLNALIKFADAFHLIGAFDSSIIDITY